MSIGVVIAIAVGAIGVVGFNLLKQRANVKQINKNENDKKAIQTNLDANAAERATLKETVIEQQHNAPEEQKEQFWNDFTKDKK